MRLLIPTVLICLALPNVQRTSDAANPPAEPDAPTPAAAEAPKSVETLAAEKVETAEHGFEISLKMYKRGVVGIDTALAWSVRIAEAKRDRHWKTPADRIAGAREFVKRAQETEQMVEQQVAAGTAPALDAVACKFARLQAEESLAEQETSFK